LEYIMPGLPQALAELKIGRRLLLLSDFDGTLAPIAERPEGALLPEKTREMLRRLSHCHGVTVGIISGRALSDLKARVDLDGLIYAGNHGFEIEGMGLSFINPIASEIRPVFRVICKILSMTLASFKGVFVEDKGITISVHYRQAEENAGQKIQQVVESSLRGPRFAGLLKMTSGKKVLELRPAVSWDKGKAVRLLMKRLGKGGRLSGLIPIYLGDDSTDEDVFKVINAYGMGLSIHVGSAPVQSLARYYLKSPAEVTIFLGGLLSLFGETDLCPRYSIA
jgi:trehalose 6-phosphate phosphatase